MRTYLVVMDGTPEAQVALRFAARRAIKTGGGVEILALVEQIPDLMPWVGVQAAIEDDLRRHTEGIVAAAAGGLMAESGLRPAITVRQGDGPRLVRELIAANGDVAALVLGAAASGAPGPLIAHFAGADAGALPVPLMIVPGSLDREAIDRLS